jgi:hypothetical protein
VWRNSGGFQVVIVKRGITVVVFAALALLLLPVGGRPAVAYYDVPSISYTGGIYNSCTLVGILPIPVYVRTAGTGSFYVVATAPNYGVISSMTGNITAYADQQATFGLLLNPTKITLADHTPITVFIQTYDGPNQTGRITLLSTGAWDCTTGNTVSPASYTIPPASIATYPNGFVLKVILCETPIYDAPAGHTIGSNAIHYGQTWFVNPVAAKDSRGKAWTEVYVGSPNTVYIPSACVAN